MKKTFKYMSMMLAMLACTTTFVACGDDDDDDNNGGGNVSSNADLVGTWSSENATYVFTDNTLTIRQYGGQSFQGSYTINNGKITYIDSEQTHTATVKLLYGKTIMVLKAEPDNPQDYSMDVMAEILFKQGATPNTPASDIQGTWDWYMGGQQDYIRTRLKIDGNKFDMIITPWGQRYTGTFTYQGGILKLNTEHGFTTREEGSGDGWGEGELDPTTLEGTWKTLDNWMIWEEMPFVADGSEAYGSVANLPAVFVKK